VAMAGVRQKSCLNTINSGSKIIARLFESKLALVGRGILREACYIGANNVAQKVIKLISGEKNRNQNARYNISRPK
jgi:hypothetical protein